MVYDPEKHHRRSIRLKGYNYSWPGAYFVTICTHEGLIMFGEVVGNEMRLNGRGEIAQALWETLPERFPTIELDAYVVMPNHLHGIIVQVPGEESAALRCPDGKPNPDRCKHSLLQPARSELGQAIRTYKAATTRLIRAAGAAEFSWHRNYYEHIIRNEPDLERIRWYIADNPARWVEDKLYRAGVGRDESRPYESRPYEGAG